MREFWFLQTPMTSPCHLYHSCIWRSEPQCNVHKKNLAWFPLMKGRCIERSWVEQLILGGTTWGSPHCPLLLSLLLVLWPVLERWMDEGFKLFEIWSMVLWTMLAFLDRERIEGWAQRVWKKYLLPYNIRLIKMKISLLAQERGSRSHMHTWYNVHQSICWLERVIVCEWILFALAVDEVPWIWSEAMSRLSKYREEFCPN